MQHTADRSDPQRLRALEKANEVRLARAAIKRQIAVGEASAAAVILDCPGAAESWPLGELLLSQRRWGAKRCRKFLSHHGLLETKRIGSLTDRQRQMLAIGLGARMRERELAGRRERDLELVA